MQSKFIHCQKLIEHWNEESWRDSKRYYQRNPTRICRGKRGRKGGGRLRLERTNSSEEYCTKAQKRGYFKAINIAKIICGKKEELAFQDTVNSPACARGVRRAFKRALDLQVLQLARRVHELCWQLNLRLRLLLACVLSHTTVYTIRINAWMRSYISHNCVRTISCCLACNMCRL